VAKNGHLAAQSSVCTATQQTFSVATASRARGTARTRWNAYGSRKGKEEGEVHRALHHISIELLEEAFFELVQNFA
jgi:hypothetical protein